jgi:hypothetical protein
VTGAVIAILVGVCTTGAVIAISRAPLFFPKMYPASTRKPWLPASSADPATSVSATRYGS